MNTLRNSVQLVGHLGKDPEVTDLDKGKKLARVSMAVNEFYTSAKGEKTSNTQWVNLIAWDKKAEYLSNHLVKGNDVMVQGKLSSRSYEDKSGQTKYVTEIVVNEVYKINRPKED